MKLRGEAKWEVLGHLGSALEGIKVVLMGPNYYKRSKSNLKN
jgi:hypothetical protein